jgi:hypothetical protein
MYEQIINLQGRPSIYLPPASRETSTRYNVRRFTELVHSWWKRENFTFGED